MIATVKEVNANLRAFVKMAEEEDVILLDDGKPVGVITGFSNPEDFEEHQLLTDPRFEALVEKSRREFREGNYTRLEDL